MAVPILRTSERRDAKRCIQRWQWGWREGLKPKGSEKTPLWFGTGFHLGLAHWYLPGTKRGVHPAETFAKYAEDALHTIKVADATEEMVAQYEDGASLGVTLAEEYVKTYGNDPSWDFIQAEKPFRLMIPWPDNHRQQLYVIEPGVRQPLIEYCGTFDGVYRNLETGEIELLETKTAKAIMLTHLTLDDQAGSYYAVANRILRQEGLLGPKERIHGINYNFIRKALPDERPKDAEGYFTNKPVKADYLAVLTRQPLSAVGRTNAELAKLKLDDLAAIASTIGVTVLGERSKSQPTPLFHRELVHRTSAERNSQLVKIQNEAVVIEAFRDGTLPITKNPTKDCSWDCSFFAMCELQDRGGAWEDFKRLSYRVEDPYADHRKSADE